MTDVKAVREKEISDVPPVELRAATIVISDVSDLHTTNSAQNVLRWRAYLPDACVERMIKMGWDNST
jgi:hypothetical protein